MKEIQTLIIFVCVMTFIWFAGCEGRKLALNEASQSISQVKDFGNGVFYFPYSGERFGQEFSAWRASHKNWIIIAVVSDDEHGWTRGYYVIANPDL